MKNLEDFFNIRYAQNKEVRAYKKDKCIHLLHKFINKTNKKFRILDVGCGTGIYTSKMIHKNSDVTGTDFSQIALDQLPKEIKKKRSDVSMKLPFDDDSFEVIMLMDILELVPDLILFKNELKRILKNDGLIIGCVPNSNFLINIMKQLITGKSISQIFYGTHTRFYSKRYLYSEFNADGFRVNALIGITKIIKKISFVQNNPICSLTRDFVFSISLKN